MTYTDYVAAVMADAPKAFWPMQDSADFPQDVSGNGKHMDSKGVVGSIAYRGAVGPRSAFSVALASAYVMRAADPVLTAVDNLTMEVWLSAFSGGNAFEPVFAVASASGATNGNSIGSNGFMLSTSNTLHPLVRVLNGGALSSSATSTNGYPGAGFWSHYVVVRRAGTWELWINGVRDTSIGTLTATPGSLSGLTVFIGHAESALAQGEWVAYAALYDTPLSGARIAAHYAAMNVWPSLEPIRDDAPTAVEAGSFTTQGGNGIVGDRPPHQADYPMLSWLQSGGTGTQSPVSGRVRIL